MGLHVLLGDRPYGTHRSDDLTLAITQSSVLTCYFLPLGSFVSELMFRVSGGGWGETPPASADQREMPKSGMRLTVLFCSGQGLG